MGNSVKSEFIQSFTTDIPHLKDMDLVNISDTDLIESKRNIYTGLTQALLFSKECILR